MTEIIVAALGAEAEIETAVKAVYKGNPPATASPPLTSPLRAPEPDNTEEVEQ